MPFAKRGDVVHSEATSGFNNQKKSLLINGLAALGDSLYPLHSNFGLTLCFSTRDAGIEKTGLQGRFFCGWDLRLAASTAQNHSATHRRLQIRQSPLSASVSLMTTSAVCSRQ